MPVILILLPGFVFFSLSGLTKSSLRRILILFGCSPPSRLSGTSSRTIPWASTSSLLSKINFPFLPQPHFDGSLKLPFNCKTLIILPHTGHSTFAAVTWGLTSDFCLTIPSAYISLPMCLLLMFLIIIFWFSGRFLKRTLKPFISSRSNCSTASSIAFIVSSGLSNRLLAKSRSNLESSTKSTTTNLLSFLKFSTICE